MSLHLLKKFLIEKFIFCAGYAKILVFSNLCFFRMGKYRSAKTVILVCFMQCLAKKKTKVLFLNKNLKATLLLWHLPPLSLKKNRGIILQETFDKRG